MLPHIDLYILTLSNSFINFINNLLRYKGEAFISGHSNNLDETIKFFIS